ncbi:hypothetical protein BC835DRAFT_1302851 [Cytidiella melzeri]|nr:hypothetical protein BC835DRAFT_1302851 [Cytidiella melzeri]
MPSPATQKKRFCTEKTKKDNGKEAEERRKDPRGTGPKMFATYTEEELNITTQGGDTPLCLFDCQHLKARLLHSQANAMLGGYERGVCRRGDERRECGGLRDGRATKKNITEMGVKRRSDNQPII